MIDRLQETTSTFRCRHLNKNNRDCDAPLRLHAPLRYRGGLWDANEKKAPKPEGRDGFGECRHRGNPSAQEDCSTDFSRRVDLIKDW